MYACSDWYLHSDLQFDLNEFQKWCESNLLFVNRAKCKLMTFYRSSMHLDSYRFGNHSLDRINTSNVLGVLFGHKQ